LLSFWEHAESQKNRKINSSELIQILVKNRDTDPVLPTNFDQFFQKKNQSLLEKKNLLDVTFFLHMQRFFFPWIFLFLFFAHISILSPPPTHLVRKYQHLANPTHPSTYGHNP